MSVYLWGPWMRSNKYGGKKKLVILAIADAVGPDGQGFISQSQMMQWSGSSDVHVYKCVKEFIEDGVLEIVQKGTGPGRATVYRLNPPTELGGTDPDDERGVRGNPLNSEGNPLTPPSSPPSLLPASSVQPAADADWVDFWAVYPTKDGKQPAMKAWAKAIKGTDPKVIIEAAKVYAELLKQPGAPKPKYAQGWLNDRRWEDEVLQKASKGPTLHDPSRLEAAGFTRQDDGSWLNTATMQRIPKELVA